MGPQSDNAVPWQTYGVSKYGRKQHRSDLKWPEHCKIDKPQSTREFDKAIWGIFG